MKVSVSVTNKKFLLELVEKIKSGELNYYQPRYFSRDDKGNLCRCFGGWITLLKAKEMGFEDKPEDWDNFGRNPYLLKFMVNISGEEDFSKGRFAAQSVGLPVEWARENLFKWSLTLENIKKNIESLEVKETVDDKIARLEKELAEAKKEKENQELGKEYSLNGFTYFVVTAFSPFDVLGGLLEAYERYYLLVNKDNGNRWCHALNKEDLLQKLVEDGFQKVS